MDQEIISIADKVIEILKQRKIMELSELVKQTEAQESDIKLIVDLLEKEGMVEIEYNMTKTLVSWNDEADRLLLKMHKNQRIVSLDSPKHVSKSVKSTSVKSTHIHNKSDSITSSKSEPSELKETKPSEIPPRTSSTSEPASDISKFSILDGNFDNQKIEKQIKEMESKLKQKEDVSSSKHSFSSSFSSAKSTKEVEEIKISKPSNARNSSFNIGPFAVKERETDQGNSAKEKGAVDRFSNLSQEEFEHLNSKSENILDSKLKHRSTPSKPSAKTKKEKEIDKEVKEIERTLMFRLGESVNEGENYDIVDFKESDIVKKVKTDLRKSHGSNSGKAVLNNYKSESEKTEQSFPTAVQKPTIQNEILLSQLKDKLDAIVNKKAEIAELNSEKTLLFDDSYLKMKSKLTTEISEMKELLESRQVKMSDLQARLSKFPDQIKKLESDITAIKQAQSDLNEEFSISMKQMQELKSEIKEARADGIAELSHLKESLELQEKELERIDDIYSTFKSNEEKISNSIEFVRNRIRNSQVELLNLEKELEDIQFNSQSIHQRLEETTKSLKQTKSSYEKAMVKLNNLNDLEFKISMIEDSYNSLKSELDLKLETYEKEMFTLKQSLQLDFTKKYLQELERLTFQNEDEFKSLLEREKEIDNRIEVKKKELASLIEQAKQLQELAYQANSAKLDSSNVKDKQFSKQSSVGEVYNISPEHYEISTKVDKLTLTMEDISEKEAKSSGLIDRFDQFLTDITKKIK